MIQNNCKLLQKIPQILHEREKLATLTILHTFARAARSPNATHVVDFERQFLLLAMAKILQKYIKFSAKELDKYATTPGSCVRCINTDKHLAMGAYGMANFKHALHELLIRTKVGFYDSGLDGIVLGIKNIKMLGHTAALRADDPTMHLVINADFYVFRPVTGAILDGVVRHISKHQVSAVIYRVFNTTIRFTNQKHSRESIEMEQEIKFRIKNFDVSNAMPYIEGELLLEDGEEPQVRYIWDTSFDFPCLIYS